MRSLLTTTLAVVLSLGLLSQTGGAGGAGGAGGSSLAGVPRPGGGGDSSTSTPVAQAADAADCSTLDSYQRALDGAFAKAGDFAEVLNSSTIDYSTFTPAEGKKIIKDGDVVIAAVGKLDAPAIYADGNKGIVLLLTYLNQEVSFYTVDSSTVPDTDNFTTAATLIHDGEITVAKQCPKEIKKLGGFIFIDPAQIDPNM